MPGRLITDNTLVANELAHYLYNRKQGNDSYLALKLDVSKTYDKMEWSYLREIMIRMGFLTQWVCVIMEMVVHTATLHLPEVFVRVTHYLLTCFFYALRAYQLVRVFIFAWMLGAPTIHHLLFADNILLFSHASPEACSQIQFILQTNVIASSQQVNLAKSIVCFSQNLAIDAQQELAGLLGVDMVSHHEKYLGLPTYVGKAKTKTFANLKDNLRKRLSGWKGKLFSVVGKELLIKVVTQALPTYVMSCFLLPSSLCLL